MKWLLGKRRRASAICGSTITLVHNLGRISWDENAPAFPWAVEFDAWCRDRILARDEKSLTEGYLATESGRLSVPTQEHYLPFL